MGLFQLGRHKSAVRSAATFASCAVISFAGAATPPQGYDIKTASLTGPGYEYTMPGGGIFRGLGDFALVRENGSPFTTAGQLAGTSGRMNSSGSHLGQDAWLFNGTSSQVIGLSGIGYQWNSPAGLFRSSSASYMSAAGKIAGFSNRIASSGNDLGNDTWLYDAGVAQVIGLSGAGYQYAAVGGAYRHSMPSAIDTSGRVTGISTRYATDGNLRGQDVFFYNGTTTQVINLTGAGYEIASPGGVTREGELRWTSPNGNAVGDSTRMNSAFGIGTDAWIFNGSTTQLIGLTGPGYEYTDAAGLHRNSLPARVNNAGRATGNASRNSSTGVSLGNDGWYFNGSTTQLVGLTGAGYQYSTGGGTYRENYIIDHTLTSGGTTYGVTARISSSASDLGSDGWIFNGTTTQYAGLIGAGYEYAATGGNYRVSQVNLMNDAGHAVGINLRWTATGVHYGYDAWLHNGATATRINPIGGVHEYTDANGTRRSAEASILTEASRAGGHAQRYGSGGENLGTDVWTHSAGATQVISLSGAAYEKSVSGGTFRSGFLDAINDDSGAIGRQERFAADGSPLGQAGWYFDLLSNVVTPLEFSYRADGYSWTDPALVTDTGVVLGSYDKYSGSTLIGRHAFWWSDDGGFHDLGDMVAGGLGANGWDALHFTDDTLGTSPGGAPQYIVGRGSGAGQPGGPGGYTAYVLTAKVPEPTAVAMVAATALVLARRRPRGRGNNASAV